MRSLTWKLTLVILGMSLFSIASVFLLTRWVTVREFDRLVNAQARASFIEQVTTYYRQTGQWQGVMCVLPALAPPGPNPPPGAPPREPPYALLDQQGCVVVPAGPYRLGACPAINNSERRDVIIVDGEEVGTIVKVRDAAGRGPLEEAYLLRTNRALFLSATGVTILAIILGLIVARTLVRPLRALTRAIRAHSAWETQARQQQITLTLEVPTALPTITLDPERIMQVLNNLVSNALRHTPAGGTIVLGAEATGNEMVFTVRDSGQGMAKEELALVFERFYRVDPARQETTGNSGLGLAIARSIVTAHGGTLTAESDGIGSGATFRMRFPAQPNQPRLTLRQAQPPARNAYPFGANASRDVPRSPVAN